MSDWAHEISRDQWDDPESHSSFSERNPITDNMIMNTFFFYD